MADERLASTDTVIREARDADCDALTALMLRSRAYQGRYHAIIAAYPVTSEMVAAGGVWLVEESGSLAGFYRLDIASAELDLMFVDDAFQGGGIGRMLIEHARSLSASNGLHHIRIVSHPPAVDFYRRMGAVDVGTSKATSAGGWDRPILQLAVA